MVDTHGALSYSRYITKGERQMSGMTPEREQAARELIKAYNDVYGNMTDDDFDADSDKLKELWRIEENFEDVMGVTLEEYGDVIEASDG
jgi:hypothetical protein